MLDQVLVRSACVRLVDIRLMIACTAEAEDDAIRLDEKELEHAFWASADDVRRAFACDDDAPFIAPPSMAVAYHLLRYWLELQG